MATLHAVPEFSGVRVGTEVVGLDGALTLSNLGRGTQLYAPGDVADRIFLLGGGRVKIAAHGPAGKHCVFHVVEPGEIFGEAALLGEQTRCAAAEVLERASVTMIPVSSVLAYADENPHFWSTFLPMLRRRARSLEEQIQWVSFLEVEQRIARLILRWAESHDGHHSTPVEFRMSQRDLAGMIGATRETTSSALNRLQREGCIELRRRCVIVQSLERLREHAGRLDPDPTTEQSELAQPSLVRVHAAGRAG